MIDIDSFSFDGKADIKIDVEGTEGDVLRALARIPINQCSTERAGKIVIV